MPHASLTGAKMAALRDTLNGKQRQLQQRVARDVERKPLDPSTKEKIRALGYDPE